MVALIILQIVQVFVGVSACLILGALPFLSKTVREREQGVANMRDDNYDAINSARDSRLSLRKTRTD